MATSDVLAVEKGIALSHQCLTFAIKHASCFRELNFHDDLQMIQLELERMQEDLLKSPMRRRAMLTDRAYLYTLRRDDDTPAAC